MESLSVKEFWKSVKNLQSYRYEFGVFLGHSVEHDVLLELGITV